MHVLSGVTRTLTTEQCYGDFWSNRKLSIKKNSKKKSIYSDQMSMDSFKFVLIDKQRIKDSENDVFLSDANQMSLICQDQPGRRDLLFC